MSYLSHKKEPQTKKGLHSENTHTYRHTQTHEHKHKVLSDREGCSQIKQMSKIYLYTLYLVLVFEQVSIRNVCFLLF